MSADTSETFRISPLRRLVAEPVTDPIELAALNALQKRSGEGVTEVKPELIVRIIELCRQSPENSDVWLVGQLFEMVSTEQKLAWIESLLVQIPPHANEHIAEQLLERLGKPVS